MVAESSGRLVLVGGEAGVGKTALLRAFCERSHESGGSSRERRDPLLPPRARPRGRRGIERPLPDLPAGINGGFGPGGGPKDQAPATAATAPSQASFGGFDWDDAGVGALATLTLLGLGGGAAVG